MCPRPWVKNPRLPSHRRYATEVCPSVAATHRSPRPSGPGYCDVLLSDGKRKPLLAAVAKRRRLRDAVPVAMFGPGLEPFRRGAFSESATQLGELGVEQAHELLQYFLTR